MDSVTIAVFGCGSIGHPLAERLARQGHRVYGVRRSARAEADTRYKALSANVSQPESLAVLPPDLDYAVYCLSPSGLSEHAYDAVFVAGLNNVIQSLEQHSPYLRRLIFVSSTSVYHQHSGETVTEDSPTQPSRFQGQKLLAGEALLKQSILPTTSVRFSGIYGGDRTRLLEQIRLGNFAPGNPSPITNRIHESDCIGILDHLLQLDLAGTSLDDCYLASDCEPVSRKDLLDWLATRIDCVPPRDSADNAKMRGGSKRCNNSRLLSTGYQFIYPTFREGYQEMIKRLVLTPP